MGVLRSRLFLLISGVNLDYVLITPLQILCGLEPYHEAQSEFQVVDLVRHGCPPSQRPRGARGSLISDTMWAALAACWRSQEERPTSRIFLDELVRMLRTGEVSTSPVFLDLFPIKVDGPLVPWPVGLVDLAALVFINSVDEPLASGPRATLWQYVSPLLTQPLVPIHGQYRGTYNRSTVVIKVPRLNESPDDEEPHLQLQHVSSMLDAISTNHA
jgi:hypothetical protein